MTDCCKPVADWVTCPRPQENAKSRLFCFPYAGVGASAYAAWPRSLGTDVEVWYIHLPGRESRFKEAPFRRFPEVVDRITESLMPVCGKEFSFFGHSLGGLISFEVARRMQEKTGVVPRHLIVSATRAPRVAWPFPLTGAMTDAEFVAEVQQRYQGIPKQIRDEPELLAFLLPALRADVELLEGYRYLEDTPLESRITVFGGSDDSMVPWEALEGWQNESSKEVEIRMFDGNHFFVQQQRDAVIGSVTTILRGESVSAIGVGE